VRLSPTWATTPRPLGFAPEPVLGLEFLASRSRLFRDGMGLGPATASGARHRPTPGESRTLGSVRAKAEWLRYSTTTALATRRV
jgi:hypothetical protein